MQKNKIKEWNTIHKLVEIDPNEIGIVQVNTTAMVNLTKKMTKAIWRPAPGRKLAFIVTHKDKLIGLIFLASPVINLTVRDTYLKLNKNRSKKGYELKNYFDMSVCVGVQPLSWYWNIGKLCAMLAPTLGDFIKQRYLDCDFKGITTSALWGRGSMYNRIYKFLGYSKGYGHFQISDERYKEMLAWLKDNGYEIPSCKLNSGSNFRMRRILAYKKYSKDKSVTLKHGQKRGVYFHLAVDNNKRQEVIDFWYNRWGLSRYEKKRHTLPPYNTGLQGASYEEKLNQN